MNKLKSNKKARNQKRTKKVLKLKNTMNEAKI